MPSYIQHNLCAVSQGKVTGRHEGWRRVAAIERGIYLPRVTEGMREYSSCWEQVGTYRQPKQPGVCCCLCTERPLKWSPHWVGRFPVWCGAHMLFQRCAGSTDDLFSEPSFFSSAFPSDPPLCPLLIFHGKKKHSVSAERRVHEDIRAIDARSSCKQSSGRLQVMWAKVRLSMNPTIYPAQAAQNRGNVPYFHSSIHQQLPGGLPQHSFMTAAVKGSLGVCQVKLRHRHINEHTCRRN